MTTAWWFAIGFCLGSLTCIVFLALPLQRLCNRWMDFYADDIKAAKARLAETEQALAPVEPKTGSVN